ncbi:MAG TPA: class I SAM-dependent methyltransferase family protein [Dehalococcoidales bacterium]
MNIWLNTRILLGRLAVRTLGQTSDGIRLVTTKGLTSGVMLDYIYQNQPHGRFIIGRWIDRIYLSHRAWEDVRIRKTNLVAFLVDAVAVQRSLNRKPVIVDVAAGSARYILDVKSKSGMEDVSIICRDLDTEALEQGKLNARTLGLTGIQFTTGDALKAESLAEIQPKANIAVSSGFYDWFNEDGLVQKSISLLYDILPSGGCFLFTNQARHVNQEFTQGVFMDLRGQPLRMTMRPAAKLNGWAEAAGFRILKTTGDKDFNYSVTLAQKP